MIYRQHVNVKTSTKLLFLIILMIIYVGFDVLSSASAGNDNSERTRVYIVLFAIMLIMFFDLLLKPHISYDGYPVLIAIYAIYYVLNLFILKLEIEWHAISNLAIVVWWFLTCLYFRNAMISSHDLFRSIYQFMFVMFWLYLAIVLYSSANIVANYKTVAYARVGYIYHVLSMLPFLLLDRNRRRRTLVMLITIVFTLFSFKRGAIIVLPFVLFVFFVLENKISDAKHNLLLVIALVFAFAVTAIVFDRYSNGYLSRRFTQADLMDGSGRSRMISLTMGEIKNRSFIQNLFGIKNENEIIYGSHNEWILQLYSLGIIGDLLYAASFIYLIRRAIILIKRKSCLAPAFAAMVTYSLLIGMGSGWLFTHSTFYIMIFISVTLYLSELDNETVLNILDGKNKS